MRRLAALILSLSTLLACSPARADSNQLEEISGFESWKAVSSAPIAVPEYLYTLCRAHTAEESAIMRSPHRNLHIRVRVNPKGESSFFSEKFDSFPVGSVIVKEKFSSAEFKDPESLGVMSKTDHGWEFSYRDEKGRVFRGSSELPQCYSCHVTQTNRDQVFRTYRTK